MTTLFDLPPSSGTLTSAKAADAIRPSAETLRQRVLAYIRTHGAYGATDEEIQRALDMPGDTERPRRWELVERKLIEDSGQTRKTSSGREAVVWRVR